MQHIHIKKLNYSEGVLGLIFFIAAAAAILGFPSTTSKGAYEGLKISSSIIIPSLFPFTVFSLFFVKSGGLFIVSKKINKITQKLFGIGGTEFSVIIISLLGGYSVGAKIVSELKVTNQIDEYYAKQLLKYCANPSPAFFINIIGINILGSKAAGVLLLISNLVACLFLNIINLNITGCQNQFAKNRYKKAPLSVAFVESVTEGAKIIIGISAFVVLFSAVAAVLKGVIKNDFYYSLLCPFLEISFGVTEVKSICLAPALYSFLLCFGGLSTICQIKQAAGKISAGFGFIILHRIIHGALSYGISFLLFKIFPIVKETISNGVTVNIGEMPLFVPSVALIIFAVVFLLFINGENEKLNLKS